MTDILQLITTAYLLASIVWIPIVIYFWHILFRKALPEAGKTVETKIEAGAKALLETAKKDMQEEIAALKIEFNETVTTLAGNTKGEIWHITADVTKQIGEVTANIAAKVEATVVEVKEGIASEIMQTVDGMYDNVATIITDYMKRFSDPNDKEIGDLVFYAVTRGWAIIVDNPEFQNRIKGFMDRKVDYVVDHFIKRMKEDPEFRKEIMDLVKPMAAEAGFDFNDPMAMLTGMFGGNK